MERLMKKILSISVLLFALLLAGCSDDDATNPVNENPFTKEGIQYKIDGASFSSIDCNVLSHFPVRYYFTVVSPDSTGIQLLMLPDSLGTYENTVGENEYRRFNVRFKSGSTMYYADNERGKAKITLTQVGKMGENGAYDGIVKGSFSGTFVAEDKSEIVVTDGFFYAVQPNLEQKGTTK